MINRKLNTSIKKEKDKKKKIPYYYFFKGDYKIPHNLCLCMKYIYIQMKHNEKNKKHLITNIGFFLLLPNLHCKEDN